MTWLPIFISGLGGLLLFTLAGNNSRGYIDTSSLFVWWGSQWIIPGAETQHGLLLLPLALFLLWRNWKRDACSPAQPRFGLGTLVLLIALLMHLLGFALQQTRISIAALLLFLWGIAWLASGVRGARASRFPLFLMLFAMPMSFLDDSVGFWMRLWVSQIAAGMGGMLGFDVVRQGTQLMSDSGDYFYDVAPACSGVRSLVALTALSLLVGYFAFRSGWRRGLLLVLALPYAFAGNVLRIFAIIAAAELFGREAGTVVHEWFGFLIFVVVLALALLTVTLLDRFCPETQPTEASHARENLIPPSQPAKRMRLSPLLTSGVIAFALAGTALLARGTQAADGPLLAGVALAANGRDPAPLPAVLSEGDWLGRHAEVTAVERSILPPDTGFARRIYRGPDNHEVFLSVVLSGSQSSALHRPELCLRGQGWTIRSGRAHTFTLEDRQLPVTLLEIERSHTFANGETRKISACFAYFFIGHDVFAATHYTRVWEDALSRIQGEPTRWAYVVLQAFSADGEAVALERMEKVLAAAFPHITNESGNSKP